ncbi:MAG: primosomal protein N', partial [Blautia sp.]|nr:primosomal protein N' [Blautia sp.]
YWVEAELSECRERGGHCYMELIEKVISEGKQAIVLIPEISLTYQTVKRFQKRFGDLVSVQNSRLSAGERYDQFLRAKRGEISVMVGPRSALFTPFAHLGLIVIDEEHENAYKSEQTPRYHARETAIERAKNEGASVVLGSATPSLESYYRALRGEYFLVSLSGRYEGRAMPEVAVLDLRKELKEGNRSILSRELQKEIQDRLDKKEQVMLFLNRRGYAGFVSCRSCGEVMQCPHCAVSLSEHQGGRLVCHYCGYEIPKPALCPVCSSPYIGGFKAGTQQVQQVVQKMFPQARVLRMDSDTTRNKGSYEKILSSFASGEADILIGTQMIVKGHDFPRVTLVGAVAADLSLNDSDFRCAERTFQLLTQAAGRAGRGEGEGKAVFQTYHPEHYSIQAAARQDYEEFYREEIGFRSLMEYPPAAHMMAVLGSGRDEEKLGTAMQYLALFIRRLFRQGKIGLIGPAPASVSKVKDIYHQVLYLKHQDITVLAKVRNSLDKYMEINEGFRNIYIQYDVE